jgi:hypothetical protein
MHQKKKRVGENWGMDMLLVVSCCCLVLSFIAVVYVAFAIRSLKPVKKETARRVKDYPATYPCGW